MAVRAQDERINELKRQGVELYSISKADTINQCLYQSYLSYVKHEKGKPNIYSLMGTKVHDTLELMINNERTQDDLKKALESELEDMEMLGYDFPRDIRGGTSIRDNWIKNMRHFCESFVVPKGKFETEQLFTYHLSDTRAVRGYIDLIQIHDEENKIISIYDWKTSSQFTKENLLEHGRQLVLYALGKEAEGYTVKNVRWIMLKYVEIKYEGFATKRAKKKTPIIKIVDRHKIAATIADQVTCDLIEEGYDEIDAEMYVTNMKIKNSLDELPEEIKSKYVIKPYVRKYEITDELKEETVKYMNDTADKFEALSKDNEDEWTPVDINKSTEFFCNNLCDYKDKCKYLQRYRDLKRLEKFEDDDLF